MVLAVFLRHAVAALALLALAGCRGEGDGAGREPGGVVSSRPAGTSPEGRPPGRPADADGEARSVPAPAPAAAPLVVFLGDSLTAGLGLPADETFPALLAEELGRRGRPIRAVNAGVSGDTTAGGLRRADWVLSQKPAVVVVALGANDGLRGLPLEEVERNLRAIVAKARTAGARVLLCGMLLPTSHGPEYRDGFGRLFPRVAREEGVPLVPFLLKDVAGRAEKNLEDGIHPNAEGQRLVAGNVLPQLERLLTAAR